MLLTASAHVSSAHTECLQIILQAFPFPNHNHSTTQLQMYKNSHSIPVTHSHLTDSFIKPRVSTNGNDIAGSKLLYKTFTEHPSNICSHPQLPVMNPRRVSKWLNYCAKTRWLLPFPSSSCSLSRHVGQALIPFLREGSACGSSSVGSRHGCGRRLLWVWLWLMHGVVVDQGSELRAPGRL